MREKEYPLLHPHASSPLSPYLVPAIPLFLTIKITTLRGCQGGPGVGAHRFAIQEQSVRIQARRSTLQHLLSPPSALPYCARRDLDDSHHKPTVCKTKDDHHFCQTICLTDSFAMLSAGVGFANYVVGNAVQNFWEKNMGSVACIRIPPNTQHPALLPQKDTWCASASPTTCCPT